MKSLDVQLGTMVISHQDGDLVYKLERGGYCITDRTISISVETTAIAEEQFPDCALICLERHPLDLPLKAGDVFNWKGGMFGDLDSSLTKAHGYFTFHAEEITVTWTVEAVEIEAIIFLLEATHDDVDYYDERAKRTPTRGRFRLTSKALEELWIPG